MLGNTIKSARSDLDILLIGIVIENKGRKMFLDLLMLAGDAFATLAGTNRMIQKKTLTRNIFLRTQSSKV